MIKVVQLHEVKQEREMVAEAEKRASQKVYERNQEREAGNTESTEEKMEEYATTLENALEGQAKVDYNWIRKEFIIIPLSNGLIEIIEDYVLSSQGVNEWDEFVRATQQLSNGAISAIGEGYSFNVINPSNHDNVILKIEDGIILFSI